MPECFAAADLVIGRSGASTISELEAPGKASILIPSPNVAENHQYHNAMTLVRKNAAVIIEEKDLTGQRLCAEFDRLCAEPERLRLLGKNAAGLAITDANERIYQQIEKLFFQKLRYAIAFHRKCLGAYDEMNRSNGYFIRKEGRLWIDMR